MWHIDKCTKQERSKDSVIQGQQMAIQVVQLNVLMQPKMSE